jgi:hypothetical protein
MIGTIKTRKTAKIPQKVQETAKPEAQNKRITSKIMRSIYIVVFFQIIVICCAPRTPLQCSASSSLNFKSTPDSELPENPSLNSNQSENKSSKTAKTAKPKNKTKKSRKKPEEKCYCQLSGKTIHDTNCLCNIDELIEYSENSIYPLVEQLVLTDFFRLYKVNLNNGCKYWNEHYLCKTNKCGILPCTNDDLPSVLREDSIKGQKRDEAMKAAKNSQTTVLPCPLSQVHSLESSDRPPAKAPNSQNQDFITQMSNQDYTAMTKHWDNIDLEASNSALEDSTPVYERDFCPDDDQFDQNSKYYDLLKNPEGYTGYGGEASHKVWRKIYNENCYEPKKTKKGGLPFHMKEEDTSQFIFAKDPKKVLDDFSCVEKRVFYRAVSGMHASITVHLAENFYDVENNAKKRNLTLFKQRFEHKEGQQYIHNLYFVWLLQLRAIHKAAPYIIRADLIQALFRTGDVHSDIHTQHQVLKLSSVVNEFPMHFDESNLFQGTNADEMMEEFRTRMLNIQEIIDCADCEKCRLWGKLQTHALATAVRILLTPVECIDVDNFSRDSEVLKCPEFRLSRREIVALFNGFARLTASVHYIEEFKVEIEGEIKMKKKRAKKEKHESDKLEAKDEL